MSADRDWMYMKRTTSNGLFNPTFQRHVNYFLDYAFTNTPNIQIEQIEDDEVLKIRCPCSKCQNRHFKSRFEIMGDLYKKGFMDDYKVWYVHGESFHTQDVGQCSNPIPSQHVGQDTDDDFGEHSEYDQMVMESMHQHPNQNAQAFYNLLSQANEPLWPGCENASTLSTTTRLLNWKSDCNVSDSAFDKLLPIIKDILPDGAKLPTNFYETKKMLKALELPSQRIHVCENHCMLFNGQNSELDRCTVCHGDRYNEKGNKVPKLAMIYMPIGPRLQRLFYSKKTAQHLTWHANHRRQPGKMSHPSEGQAWNHFNLVYPDFAQETRNVRLGLCTDGFSPNSTIGKDYSCWPVFITVYNLPPWLALKEKYIQIPVIIPGPKNPGQNLDVFLQPLVDELKLLFTHGIETYDAHQRHNFQMRAVLLWTISDFPAYAMLSGWSTHGKLACPYCSNKSGSFQMQHGGKPCWFDCHRQHLPPRHCFRKDKINFRKDVMVLRERHIPEPTGEEIWETVQHLDTVYEGKPYHKENRKPKGFGVTHNWVKRSIFWSLPYWHKLLIRHNLDVMHIEKNVFDNLFHTIMDTDKSKDHMKARQDIELLCDRPHLNPIRGNNQKMTKLRGNYTLQKNDVEKVCVWLTKLKFPDGYASNIGSCVNIKQNRFYSFKSHDCHVFMQRLLPLAIRGFVSKEIYEAVTELCMFFRVLCSKTLHEEDLLKMKRTIITTICKLEKIFPPGFFDSMEHLVIHLAHEALLGGPVQYRWMYQYERKLGLMKRRIKNKSKVEGSIAREHLMSEIATYCSLYFDPTIETGHNREPRNFAPQHPISLNGDIKPLSVFVVPSRRLYQKGGTQRILSDGELKKVHTYVLLNCAEVTPYLTQFDEEAPHLYPDVTVPHLREERFADWFANHVMIGLCNESTQHLKILARKPSKYAQSHKGYFVNGYKFHTQEHGKGRTTSNYGVCVRGEAYNTKESDYYGLLDEILEIEYYGNGPSTIVLFNCTWFDNRGVIVNKNKLVDVKHKLRLPGDDTFVLASQAEQVFYTSYPTMRSDTKDLWAVVKTKSRHIYEVALPETEVNDENMEEQGFLQIDERFESPDEVTSSERMCLVTVSNTTEQTTNEDDARFQVEQLGNEADTFDDGDDQMVIFDHSSDEDDF